MKQQNYFIWSRKKLLFQFSSLNVCALVWLQFDFWFEHVPWMDKFTLGLKALHILQYAEAKGIIYASVRDTI